MSELTGKCHCGQNTFSVEGDSQFQFVCHCKDCRIFNGGGHLCGMVFAESDLSPAKDTKMYAYPGGSGHPIEMHFCPSCSTQLYAFPKHHEGIVVVRANVLEKAPFKPQQVLFPESAFEWDKANYSMLLFKHPV